MNIHSPSDRGAHAKSGPRAESPHPNAIRMLLAVLLLAALAASSAAMSLHFGGHPADSLIGFGAIVNTPWMY